MVFHWRVRISRNRHFNLSHLCYAVTSYAQYQATVKLLGSFRLTAGNRHLHRYCIFTERYSETVPQSLHYSCASELTRQGISLFASCGRRTMSSSVLEARRMVSYVSRVFFRTFYIFLCREVAFCVTFSLFTRFCNSPSPSLLDCSSREP